MLASLSLIFIVGLAMGAICQKLKLPRIIGMLVTGIVLGPYVLDLLDPSNLINFCRAAEVGTDYYFVESRSFSGFKRSEKSRTLRYITVVRSGIV